MSGEIDPMLSGDAGQQQAYQDQVNNLVRAFVEQDRAARSQTPPSQDREPVIIGAVGFGDGMRAIPR